MDIIITLALLVVAFCITTGKNEIKITIKHDYPEPVYKELAPEQPTDTPQQDTPLGMVEAIQDIFDLREDV